MIVFSLCAMVSTVQSSNCVRMVIWIRSSVSRSMAAVASSRIRILVLRRRALARHTSCLWPTLQAQTAFHCPQLPTAHSHLCSAGHSSGYPENPGIFCKLPVLSAPELTHAGCSMPTLTVIGSLSAWPCAGRATKCAFYHCDKSQGSFQQHSQF